LPAIHLTRDKITRIYRELKILNSQKISDPLKKWANELNRAFLKEEVRMAKPHKKTQKHQPPSKKTTPKTPTNQPKQRTHMKFSTSLPIKEMQIKPTLRFLFFSFWWHWGLNSGLHAP
jgi:hypothetical protein